MAVVPLKIKEAPEATATLQLLPKELPWDSILYQDLAEQFFGNQNLLNGGTHSSVGDTAKDLFLGLVLQKQAMSEKHMEQEQKQKQKRKREQEEEQEDEQEYIDVETDAEQTHAEDPAPLRQCLGPGCVYATRPGSKYCSDDCGMKLAAERIYKILPLRIQQWQTNPCIADEYGKKMLERIHREQQDIHTHLKDMECHFQELEAIILRGKQQAMYTEEEIKNGDKGGTDLKIFCVSCGQSISMRVALRHMERCFAKYECQTTFGSLNPTCIEGATRLFCDVYDPQSKRYCKRLQVLCPEHSRDPKVPNDEVCGCPLVHNVFEFTGDFCRLPKRLCNHHYCWEKLRRAEVDLERVRALHKLEKLVEQEQKVRTAMMNRAGLLGLMLHQTTQHDPLTADLRSRAGS
ncbi:CXXC-type zinc finger protein 1-like [Otolemur garnettii]|uniref:CXXC-type zinc finger protein 1-like n=1 Tax=Otolemur garnettii TaxID=30611 RepID=UPI00027421F6|nr:CXXC-type zinc finger protein 1-like [Otolemur garnettii]